MFRRVLSSGRGEKAGSFSSAFTASHATVKRLEKAGTAALAAHLYLGLSACCSGEHPSTASNGLAASICLFQDSCANSRAFMRTLPRETLTPRTAPFPFQRGKYCRSVADAPSSLPHIAGHHSTAADDLFFDEMPENSAALPVLSGFSCIPVFGDPALSIAESLMLTSGSLRH